jgi:hypothetical protein
MGRLLSLGYKLYGEPPPKCAPRSEMLRWIRRFYIRPLPLLILVWVLLFIWAPTWTLILLGASALIWLQGITSLSLRIRREEQRERRQ